MGLPELDTTTFDAAARAVLRHLREHVPLGLWSVTRVENGRQTFLHLDDDNAYGLVQGQSHPWQDSICIRMAAGHGPPVAPDAGAVPSYACAPLRDTVPIGAYAGAVISEPDGSVFGAICGIDPSSRDDDARLRAAGPLLSLLGSLLSTVLAVDRARVAAAERAVRAELAADRDALTGLHNRRAWQRLVAAAEERFARFGDPTVVAVLDLDLLKHVNDSQGHAAGDEHLVRAGAALAAAVRKDDVVARLGGDEFGLVLHGCTEQDAPRRVERLHEGLVRAGVAGSIGWAPLTVLSGFPGALAAADAAMYAAKAERRRAVRV